jgi:hypothetical protein
MVKFSERAQEAHYLAAELIAKTKPHSTAVALTLPTFNAIIKTIFGTETEQEVQENSLLDSTISIWIMTSANTKESVCTTGKKCGYMLFK